MMHLPITGIVGSGSAAPFLPTDIANCALWLDANDRGSTSLRWNDKSGNARHFNSSSAGAFPSFSGGIATFDGGDFLTGPTLASLTAGEVFCQLKKDNDPSLSDPVSGIWKFGTAAVASPDHWVYNDSNGYMGFGSTTRKATGNPAQNTAAWHTLGIVTVSGEFTVYTNSTQHYTTATNTVAFHATPELGRGINTSVRLTGQIKSLVLFSRKLTAGERTSMRDYMAAL